MGYTGPAGVAGATVHGLNRVAEETKNAIKGGLSMFDPRVKEGENALTAIPIVRAARPFVEAAKQIPQIPSAIRDINASADPLGHYAQAAEDTAAQGAGQALTAIAAEKAPEATRGAVDMAGKTADVAKAGVEKAPAIVRGTAKSVNKVLAKAPGSVGAVIGGTIGHATGIPYGAEVGAGLGTVMGKELLPTLRVPGEKFGLKPIELGEPTAEPSPLKPIGSKVTNPASELKPIGSTAEATPKAPEESAEVRQARHVLGNVAVDKLKTAEGGPEALRRLTKGTYQQYADLANALEIRKPGYLAAKNGETWTADEFHRTTKTHGKELSAPKEMVVRDLLSKPPAEILQHTQPWVDPTAKYAAPMSSLTERTMKALGLSEEAKNNLRASGVSDTQAQSLLAKLTKRQLENLSETMEKGEHLPTVSGGSQGADLSPNASGESSASLENINRVASQKAKGLKIYRLNSLSGQATPILAQDAVDWRPGPAEHKIEVDGEGNISVLESGSRAHPVMKSSKIRFPKD